MDADALVEVCDPEVRFESRITAVEESVYEGHDGARRYIRNLQEAFEWVAVAQSDLVQDGDRAVATNHFRSRGRGSGVEVEHDFFCAARAREGRLLWWAFFDSRAEALEAVGLRERASHKVELAREVFDALSRGDASRVIALADPDVQWHSFFAIGEGGRAYRGHEGTRQYVSNLREAWAKVWAEVDDGLEIGDLALVVGRIHYRGIASGVESAEPAGWVLKFRDGRVVYFRAFDDPVAAIEAIAVERDSRT
jgi:ketosteroid isomerase-like protein